MSIIIIIILYETHAVIFIFTIGQQLSRSDVISALKKVMKPYLLGVHLGIDPHKLKEFECCNSKDIEQQKIEVINYWFDNFNPSWKALADAVKRIGSYNNLAKDLADMHVTCSGMKLYKP